jgi:hypothetical protein
MNCTSPFETRDLGGIDIDAKHLVPGLGEDRRLHQTDITRSENGDPHAFRSLWLRVDAAYSTARKEAQRAARRPALSGSMQSSPIRRMGEVGNHGVFRRL